METEFTRLSSKGQIVIPRRIRELLNLKVGTPFVVTRNENSVIIKKIELPKTWEETAKPFKEAVKKSGFTKEDLKKLIEEVRKTKNESRS